MDESIGRRVANHRKGRGLTQTALAQRANVSLSLLRKVEQGSRDASPALVAAVAKALGVDVSTLTGQPYDIEGPRRDAVHAQMPNLRRALNYWDVPPAVDGPFRPAAAVLADAQEVAYLRQADRNVQALTKIPELLLETTAAVHGTASGPERDALFDAMATLLHPAMSITHARGTTTSPPSCRTGSPGPPRSGAIPWSWDWPPTPARRPCSATGRMTSGSASSPTPRPSSHEMQRTTPRICG